MPGAEFGWVKCTRRSKFVPCFIYPDQTAKKITKRGVLSDTKHPIHEFQKNIETNEKIGFKKQLSKFNSLNNCSYE